MALTDARTWGPALAEQAVQVAVDNVSVTYRVPSEDRGDIAGQSRAARLRARLLGRAPMVTVKALQNVSLVAHQGDAIGIVGLNGSGKSTLLRVIAGAEKPSGGRVLATATPVLIGVNAAMVPEMSGADNVTLGCLAMGMTPQEARNALPDVVDLSGIGRSVHLPMRTYSSGMGARLRFAIAAAARPEVMLIDEALATGDAAFKERSEERMNQLRAGAGCVFLVSHAAKTVEETCTRAIWLHEGQVVIDGDAYDVAQKYRWYAWNLAKGNPEKAAGLLADARAEGTDTVVRFLKAPDPRDLPRHAITHRGRP